MKKIIFIALVVLPSLCHSQGTFTIGYNQSFGQYDSLNYIINRYNDTRDFLSDEMDEFKAMNGIVIGAGINSEHSMMRWDYNGASKKQTSKGTVNGVEMQRDIKFSLNSIGLMTGWGISNDENQLYAGFRCDILRYRLKTRVYEADQDQGDWDKIVKNSVITVGLFAQLGMGSEELKIVIEPYINFPILRILDPEIQSLNEEINPVSYVNDPEKIIGEYGSVGFRILFQISGD